jgi:hypothetical protein
VKMMTTGAGAAGGFREYPGQIRVAAVARNILALVPDNLTLGRVRLVDLFVAQTTRGNERFGDFMN